MRDAYVFRCRDCGETLTVPYELRRGAPGGRVISGATTHMAIDEHASECDSTSPTREAGSAFDEDCDTSRSEIHQTEVMRLENAFGATVCRVWVDHGGDVPLGAQVCVQIGTGVPITLDDDQCTDLTDGIRIAQRTADAVFQRVVRGIEGRA